MITKEKLMAVSFVLLLNFVTLASATPVYSSNSTNSTLAGQPTLFSLNWSDAVGLGSYIFSTNNSGTWINDSFTSFGSTAPWNSWSNEGVLIESFNSSSEWTKEGTFTIFDDASRYVEGSSSIGIWTGFQQTLAIRKAINLNLNSATNFYFWFYTDNVESIDDSDNPAVTLYLASNSSGLDDDSKYFACGVYGSELKTGWNKIVIDKNSCYNKNDAESWSNDMVSMQFRINLVDASTNSSVNFDNLRYNYNGGLLNKAVVIMTFDDGYNSTIYTAYPIMQNNSQKGVSFVIPTHVDYEEYMHLDDLTTLYNAGWDISSHSMNHSNLVGLSDAELINQVNGSKNIIDGWGFTRSSGFFAYPYHEYDDKVLSYVNSTYKMARNDFGAESQPHIYLDDPDNIPFLVKGTELLNTTEASYINWVIDRAIAQKSLLVLSFHKIENDPIEETIWSTSNFQSVSDYIKTKVNEGWLDVMTFSEYYSTIKGTENTWSNVTKTLNETAETPIGWRVYANDTTNSWNESEIFELTTTALPPVCYNDLTAIVDTYSPTEASNFIVTCNSTVGIDTVFIEIMNSTDLLVNNVSMNSTGDTWNYSIVLPAESFSWSVYANDTLGKWNEPEVWMFTINKSANIVDLYLNDVVNENRTYAYPEAVNATATSLIGDVYLYRDDVLVANASEEIILGNGTYAYKVDATGNQNYSDNTSEVTYYAFVNKGILDLSIVFNPPSPVTVGTPTTATGVENNIGNANITYELWRDGVLVSNTTPYQDVPPSSVDTYNYIFNATGNENWTANSIGVSSILTIQAASSPGSPGSGGPSGSVIYVIGDNNDEEDTTATTTNEDSGSDNVTTQTDCAEDWICSSWSDCINGTQTRTCYDTNDCGTVFNIDEETQECEEQPSIITGMFTFLTTPTGIGLMGFIALVVIFLISRTNGKLKLNFLKKLIKK